MPRKKNDPPVRKPPETFGQVVAKLPWLPRPLRSGWYVVRFKHGAAEINDYTLAEVAKEPGVSGYVFRTRDRPFWQAVRDDATWLPVDDSAST
jgi:hypothetical protein